MRRITSRKKKKKRLNQFIIGGGLIFVLFFSVLGYSLQGEKNSEVKKVNYNGFEFVNQNGFWILELGSFRFVFNNNPKQIEFNETVNISTDINSLNSYLGKPLYIFSEDSDSEREIYKNFDPRANNIVQRIQGACLEEGCDKNLPLKTCEDNFIIIKESNSSSVTQKNNCVFIEGKKEDLMKLTDEYLFKVLGVE